MSSKNTLLRKTWIGLAITIGFVAATVLLVSVPASQFTDQAAREYVAGIARIILAYVVTLVMHNRKWGWTVLTWPAPRSWAIILPVAAYSLIVYPLLFTGNLRLNLTQPNFAAGVGFNGFATGALEELIFRGLILSLLLSGNSNDHNPSNIWNAIIVSSLLFSVPHAKSLCWSRRGSCGCAVDLGFSARHRVRVLADQWQVGLAGCHIAWRYERICAREQTRRRYTTLTATCCRTGFRPGALVHLRSNPVAEANRFDLTIALEPTAGRCDDND